MQLLIELVELAKKATPGGWDCSPYNVDRGFCAQVWDSNGTALVTHDAKGERASDDVAFIAATNPATILAIAEYVNRLEAKLSNHTPDAGKMTGWVKCSERMPEDEQRVLVHTSSGYRYSAYYDEYTKLFFSSVGGHDPKGCEYTLVSHWMPATPEAPDDK